MAVPGKRTTRYLARFITQGNRLEAMYLNQTRQDSVSSKRNDPPKRFCFGGSGLHPRVSPPGGLRYGLGGGLGAGRNLGDGFQDLRSDLVGVALRVRAAIFQIT